MKSKAMWQAMKKQQEAIALEGKKWEIYHFESSDGCQHPDEIRLAHRYAAAKHQGPAQRAQLKAIVELEMARHSVLSGGMEMKPYQKKVQKVSDDYSHASNSHVFEETPAHEDFYSRLNYLDKLSKWVPKTASAAFWNGFEKRSFVGIGSIAGQRSAFEKLGFDFQDYRKDGDGYVSTYGRTNRWKNAKAWGDDLRDLHAKGYKPHYGENLTTYDPAKHEEAVKLYDEYWANKRSPYMGHTRPLTDADEIASAKESVAKLESRMKNKKKWWKPF